MSSREKVSTTINNRKLDWDNNCLYTLLLNENGFVWLWRQYLFNWFMLNLLSALPEKELMCSSSFQCNFFSRKTELEMEKIIGKSAKRLILFVEAAGNINRFNAINVSQYDQRKKGEKKSKKKTLDEWRSFCSLSMVFLWFLLRE